MGKLITFEIDIDIRTDLKHIEQAAIQKALEISAIRVQGDAKKIITSKGIVDTGRLRLSIDRDVKKNEATVGDGVDYGIYQEFGTTKQKARPFLRPALFNNATNIMIIFQDELKEVN